MEINEDAQQIMKYVKIIFLGTGGGHLLFHGGGIRCPVVRGGLSVVPLVGGGGTLFVVPLLAGVGFTVSSTGRSAVHSPPGRASRTAPGDGAHRSTLVKLLCCLLLAHR